MQVIDLGTTDPHHAVAVDASLLANLDQDTTVETLHLWESRHPAVIVGVSGTIESQVDEHACAEDGVPIIRRISGGGAVVVGRGCLNYAFALSLDARPELRDVRRSYRLILDRIIARLSQPRLEIRAMTDVALDGRKVSGNAQRRGRRALLHHGTFLYGFDSRLMERYLLEPSRRPAYRGSRNHAAFVTDLPHGVDAIKRAVVSSFSDRNVFK